MHCRCLILYITHTGRWHPRVYVFGDAIVPTCPGRRDFRPLPSPDPTGQEWPRKMNGMLICAHYIAHLSALIFRSAFAIGLYRLLALDIE